MKRITVLLLFLILGLAPMLAQSQLRVLVAGDVAWDPEIGRHLEGLGAQDGTVFRIEDVSQE